MTAITDNLVQCKYCLDVLPHKESYRRKNCNEKCNEHLYAHEKCYHDAMVIKGFAKKNCDWCNVRDPEGTGNCPDKLSLLKLAGVTVLSSALSVAGLTAIVYFQSISNQCWREDRMACSLSASAVSYILIPPTVFCAIPAGMTCLVGAAGLTAGLVYLGRKCRLF